MLKSDIEKNETDSIVYLSSETEIVNLGISRADPEKYSEMYFSSLVHASQLPDFAIESSKQNGYILAADYKEPYYMELEGDVHALALIDLDAEGLSEYKPFLENYLNTCSEQEKQKYMEIKASNYLV
jgi:hypothetical protein